MIYIKTKYYPLKGFNAITHWPFVFYKKDSETMRLHEEIHGSQQKELLLVFFYILYFVEWIFKGYKYISFEREAYANEYKGYKRKPYAWTSYLKKYVT